jgi:4-amino-4-deoxy-L-arabinose transferase-like glycosyltransferase
MLVGVRFWKDPSRGAAVVLGLVGGLAALTRAELGLFLPVVAAVVLVRSPLPWRERVVRYACCGVAALAICMPWFARNIATYDAPVFLSNGIGTVLVQANCDATYYGSDLGYWQVSCGNPPPYGPEGQILGEYERDLVVRQRASEYISANRSRLLTVVVPARVGRMWGVYEPIGQLRRDVHVDRRSMSVSLLGLAQFVLLVPLAVAGMEVLRRRRGPLLVLAAWIPIATFTAATTFGNTRYRTAAETSLVILAAVAADAILERRHPGVPGTGQPVEASQPPGGSS